jgi:hypothetical protein
LGAGFVATAFDSGFGAPGFGVVFGAGAGGGAATDAGLVVVLTGAGTCTPPDATTAATGAAVIVGAGEVVGAGVVVLAADVVTLFDDDADVVVERPQPARAMRRAGAIRSERRRCTPIFRQRRGRGYTAQARRVRAIARWRELRLRTRCRRLYTRHRRAAAFTELALAI